MKTNKKKWKLQMSERQVGVFSFEYHFLILNCLEKWLHWKMNFKVCKEYKTLALTSELR